MNALVPGMIEFGSAGMLRTGRRLAGILKDSPAVNGNLFVKREKRALASKLLQRLEKKEASAIRRAVIPSPADFPVKKTVRTEGNLESRRDYLAAAAARRRTRLAGQ